MASVQVLAEVGYDDEDFECQYMDMITIREASWKGFKICLIETVTVKSDYELERVDDNSKNLVKELAFAGTVHYLPVKVAHQLPNIVIYSASHCSLKSVKKENFEQLPDLETINLAHNYIMAIAYETFESMPRLRVLNLCETVMIATFSDNV